MARRNEHGGLVIRQSDLASYSRCPQQKKIADGMADRGEREQTLSATVYGTVIHHALQVFEEHHHAGRTDALDVALATFAHYWLPDNVGDLEPGGIDVWLPRQTYGGLREKGLRVIKAYADMIQSDPGQLLALEYQFRVPLHLDGVQHTLTGTVDRMSRRVTTSGKRRAYLNLEDYKGLAEWTPLPTPTGWTTMGLVAVGDELLGPDGLPTRVVAKSRPRSRPCYRVAFDDGSSVVCDDEHLWETHSDDGVQILDTVTLAASLINPRTGQRHQRVPNAQALILSSVDLPIDPYVLGAWLGDGKAAGGEICKPEPEIFTEIERRGWRVGPDISSFDRAESHTVYGLRAKLKAAGLFGHKHVPAAYLRASRLQRLDLLRGLMDTDGSWNKVRRRAVFATTDKALAEQVHELVASLGCKPTTFEVQRHGFGLTVTAYDVCFSPLDDNPFLLARKASQVRVGTTRSRRRLVVSVELVPTVTTLCVQVDNDQAMYLCGEGMVPTHNTGKVPIYLRHNMQFTAYTVLPETPILMSDITWRPIGEVQVGDEIMAVDEHPIPRAAGVNRRHWRKATVEAAWSVTKPSWCVTFSDGTTLTTGEGHRLLCQRGGAWAWRTVEDVATNLHNSRRKTAGIKVARVMPSVSQIPSVDYDSAEYMAGYIAGATLGDGCIRSEGKRPYWQIMLSATDEVLLDRLRLYLSNFGITVSTLRREPNGKGWQKSLILGLGTHARAKVEQIKAMCDSPTDTDAYAAGWLAGLYDTDGGLSKTNGTISIYQKDRDVLDLVVKRAASLGFIFRHCTKSVELVGDRMERIRFTAMVQPALQRKVEQMDGRTLRMFGDCRIIQIERAGEQRLCDITTSTGTYIADGIVSHNCWASLQREFWDGFDDPEDAWTKTKDWARRTTWVDMATVTRKDGGWRGPQDYARLTVAMREYIKAVEHDVYPLNLKGDVCTFCPFSRTGDCGGVAVADDDDGKPK